MNRNRILLIEDEAALALTLTDRLESEGYTVTHVADGRSGERKASRDKFDVILLDVMLPGKGGYDLLRDIRIQGVQTPVLMLTARGRLEEKLLGLKLGADDYLTKPFEMLELVARIEALLRRPASATSDAGNTGVYTFDEIIVDLNRRSVSRGSKRIELSALEFRLLQFFILNDGEILSRREILREVWGYEGDPSTRTVDTHVTWLRRKLEDNAHHPQHILTVHGVGYRFVRVSNQ